MKVLLLDGDTVQSISVIKSLKKINIYVTIFCENRISYGYCSRYPDKKVIAPSSKNNESFFLNFLVSFLKKDFHDIIIPLYNDGAEFLSKNKNKIYEVSGVKSAIVDYDVFIKAHDKELLMEICKKYGISHPRTANPLNSSIKAASEYVSFPLLIKPNKSSGARGIIFVNKKEELEVLYNTSIKKYGPCTLQEYVNHSGYYYNAMLYRTKNGEYANSVVIKIIRYFPIKGGTSSYCISIHRPELIIECQKLLNILDWHGFADIDIIEDKHTNVLKIIEINPRIPSSIKSAFISGVNFPEIMVKDTLKIVFPKYSYNSGMILRYMAMDIMWFIFSPYRFKCKPSWFKFVERNLYYQDGSLFDPLPLFAGILMGIKKYLNPSFRKSKFEQE